MKSGVFILFENFETILILTLLCIIFLLVLGESLKIQSKGYQIVHSLESLVYTVPPKKSKDLIRQRIRWSYGNLENIAKYKHLLSPKYGDLGLFFIPMGLIGIGMSSFLFIYFTVKLIFDTVHKIYLNSLIGFDIIPLFSFDGKLNLISFLTSEKTLLIMFSLLTAIIIYETARRSIKEKFRLEYLFYLLIYGWVIGLAQLIAITHFIIGKKPSW